MNRLPPSACDIIPMTQLNFLPGILVAFSWFIQQPELAIWLLTIQRSVIWIISLPYSLSSEAEPWSLSLIETTYLWHCCCITWTYRAYHPWWLERSLPSAQTWFMVSCQTWHLICASRSVISSLNRKVIPESCSHDTITSSYTEQPLYPFVRIMKSEHL
jgi:hypothetical protein